MLDLRVATHRAVLVGVAVAAISWLLINAIVGPSGVAGYLSWQSGWSPLLIIAVGIGSTLILAGNSVAAFVAAGLMAALLLWRDVLEPRGWTGEGDLGEFLRGFGRSPLHPSVSRVTLYGLAGAWVGLGLHARVRARMRAWKSR